MKNRLTQVTDPNTGVTAMPATAPAISLTVTDAKNQVTTFAYDGRNRLLSTTDPPARSKPIPTAAMTTCVTRITPRTDHHLRLRLAVNQLLSKTLPGSQVTNLYDLVGNVTTVTRSR